MAKGKKNETNGHEVDTFTMQLLELRKGMAERMRHLREETPHFEMTPQDLVGKKYPSLSTWTLATCDLKEYEDKNGWSCWVDEDGWHGMLNARGFKMRKFLTADTLDLLLDAMEAFLAASDQEWTYYGNKRSSRSRGRSRGPNNDGTR